MLTIEIPEWLQWAGVGLAIAYAIPKALRAAIVAIVFVLSVVFDNDWYVPVPRRDGTTELVDDAGRGNGWDIFFRIVSWAFKAHWAAADDTPQKLPPNT